MQKLKSVSTFKTVDYGNIYIKLKDIMDEKDIKRSQLAKAVNTRFEVIDKWYNGNLGKMDLDVLARICYVLECDICDLIGYKKPLE